MNPDRDKLVIRADARAMGAVTALNVRVAPRWKSSGTKSGECVSIFPDGSRIPFTRTRTTNPSTRLVAVKTAKRENANSYFDRLEMFGASNDGNADN